MSRNPFLISQKIGLSFKDLNPRDKFCFETNVTKKPFDLKGFFYWLELKSSFDKSQLVAGINQIETGFLS